MSIITIGIDLAKNVFAVHGVDEDGKVALVKPKVSREQLLPLIAQLPPCRIGMEACYGAHHWARLFRAYGHDVKLAELLGLDGEDEEDIRVRLIDEFLALKDA